MARLSRINDFNEQGLLYQLDVMINEYSRLKAEYLYDSRAQEIFSWSIDHLKKLRIAIGKDVRFDYLQIQKIVDELYKSDNQITGVYILFDFKCVDIPNRAILRCKLKKQ
jgi:orotidine-5'-phosphate decarboxylase